MQWLYLLTGTIMSVISVYHLFSHKHRKASKDYVFYRLKDRRKLQTDSPIYKRSIISAYFVIVFSLMLFIETFVNFYTATILFMIVFFLGLFVLLSMDRIFELRGEAIIFAGYQAKWGKIKKIYWGKQKKRKRQIIMELEKGQKIKTSIANEETQELEDVLSNYAYFVKD